MRDVLFKTTHGSRLYNLAHEHSDNDFFTVVANQPKNRARYAKQTINDGEDALVMDFSTWLQSCAHGVPQALEAMFAQDPWVLVDRLGAFRNSFRVGTSVDETYLRTMKSFCYSQEFKRKRHALRLALNMYQFTRTGKFNPTLSDAAVSFCNEHADKDSDVVYAYCMNIALDRLPPSLVL